MVKAFKGFRFDPELYARFKRLAAENGLGVTEAFERFMKACVENGVVRFPGSVDCEAEARVLLAWLRKGEYWYGIHEAEEISVPGRLLQMLSKVKDDSLKSEIEEELKKH